MTGKPFKPPSLVNRDATGGASGGFTYPPAKRRRLSPEPEHEHTPNTSQSANTVSVAGHSTQSENADAGAKNYYTVLWRKPTAKKHKTWDGDGVLVVAGGYATLQDVSGKEMGRSRCERPLFSGSTLSVGGKDVEVDTTIPKDEYPAGKPFLGTYGKPTVRELEEKLRTAAKFNAKPAEKQVSSEQKIKQEPVGLKNPPLPPVQVSTAVTSHFRNPFNNRPTAALETKADPVPRHDPKHPDAIVMKRPESVPSGKQIVDVVVDPFIGKKLREHQKEGVKFMYECVMGMRPHGGEGAILADEMGLGKTLQVIALLWTLLKQNPIHETTPVIKKALIVCPVTLIRNWKKEIRKWLGEGRVGVLVVDGNKTRIRDFTHGRAYNILVIGYEKLRTVQEDLQKGAGVDIVIADEGHRLKTAQNKSAAAIKTLSTEKRIILSGTPLQNDLSELYFMVDFVNPGLLSKATIFKREFETPIMKSRQPEATEKEIEKGKARSEELADLTSMFILRRTAEILARYLPPKSETILFCKPTRTQASVYRTVLESPHFSQVLGSSDAAFQLIHVLKKLCNSPSLLRAKADTEEARGTPLIASVLSAIPSGLLKSPSSSGKLQVLDDLLHAIRTKTDEKVVIVSHYTTTLDILGNLLSSLSYPFLRLDGSTPTSKRQALVDQFNKSSADSCFAFLLSAKSGGAGINLIGASRLVLFDIDWNPSTEDQAMARIHRDGQRRHCRIYRLLVRGALDEKIYQRQLTKRALADAVVDGKVSGSTFTTAELRRLFQLDEGETCQTHELLGCKCAGRGTPVTETASAISPIEISDDSGDDGASDTSESSDDELPTVASLISASKLDPEKLERQIAKQKLRDEKETSKKNKMQALMAYQHLDTRRLLGVDANGAVDEDADALVDDEILMGLLRDSEGGGRVGYLFTKTTS